jgi:hypothetical protein
MTALKNIPTLIGGAAVLAAATIGLTTGIASAVWDIEGYDICMGKTIRYPADCCIMNGGDLGDDGVCRAPVGNVQVLPDAPEVPPQIANANPPTVATNVPATTAPGSRAPSRLPSGGVAAP